MTLGDVVGHSGLTLWAEVAMVVFMLAFVAVSVHLLVTGRERWERARRLPLDDDASSGQVTSSSGGDIQ